MRLTVERASAPRKGTSWRPLQHTLQERRVAEVVHREIDHEGYDHVRRRHEQRTSLGAFDMLLAGVSEDKTEAAIEHPYERGRFIEGFVYVRALAAFIHQDEVTRVKDSGANVEPGAVISKGVRLEEGAQIGAYVELERGAVIKKNAVIGQDTVVRKGARVAEDVNLGGLSYVGQFARIGRGVVIESMGVIGREAVVQAGAKAKKQLHLDTGVRVGKDAWMDDSVRVGRHTYLAENTTIGEMTSIGMYSRIGCGAVVGAESQLGNLVRVAPDVILSSPTYAESGASILTSTLFAQRPREN